MWGRRKREKDLQSHQRASCITFPGVLTSSRAAFALKTVDITHAPFHKPEARPVETQCICSCKFYGVEVCLWYFHALMWFMDTSTKSMEKHSSSSNPNQSDWNWDKVTLKLQVTTNTWLPPRAAPVCLSSLHDLPNNMLLMKTWDVTSLYSEYQSCPLPHPTGKSQWNGLGESKTLSVVK